MNKWVIAAIAGGVSIACGVAGFAYWNGNQPLKEYYPNGAVKSITQRQMYKNTGKVQKFNQTGSLTEEYNQTDGIREGKCTVYFKDGSFDFNYQNGKISGPLNINSEKLSEYFKDINLSFEDSKLKLTNDDNTFDATASVKCGEDEFFANMREFLNLQNYDNFAKFAGCLVLEKADVTTPEGKCVYEGEYQYPKFLADSKITCDRENVEFLSEYTEKLSSFDDNFDTEIDISNVNIEDVEKIKFSANHNMADGSSAFEMSAVYNGVEVEQKSAFKGIEKAFENGMKFYFSPQSEADTKKFLISLLQDVSISDWIMKANGNTRSSIKGDFNFINGFSDPYEVLYYTDNQVTTQWKFNSKGTQITSKYPNSNKAIFSFMMNVNDGFKRAYSGLVKGALDIAMSDGEFNPLALTALQNYAVDLVKGISSFSGVIMNSNGEKAISAVAVLQPDFSIEKAMTEPEDIFNIKIVTYNQNKPAKIYIGNPARGFTLNGKPLSDEQFVKEMNEVAGIVRSNVDDIIAHLGKLYGDMDENKVSWIDTDIDPFLFGFYKGYVRAKETFEQAEADIEQETTAEEIERIVENVQDTYKDNPEKYAELNNQSAIEAGIVPVDENNQPLNAFGGKIVLKTSAKSDDDLNGAFIVAFSSIPDEECERFMTGEVYLLPQNGIIGVSGGNMEKAHQGFVELNKLTEESAQNAGITDVSEGFFAVKNSALEDLLTAENIKNICSGGIKNNFIAVKYY